MAVKYGYSTKGMFSFLTKEASYGAAVTVNASNFMTLKGAKIKVEWNDQVADDGEMVTGYEFATTQEITEPMTRITITEERAHPSFVAAAMIMAQGAASATQDGALAAYLQTITPMAVTSALPSINGIVVIGGEQRLYKGLICESVKISAQKEGYVTCELVLVGNGTRVANADSFVTATTESWLKARNIRAWYETSTDIAIDTTPTQGACSISATGHALVSQLQSFEWSWSNNPEMQLDKVGVDTGKRVTSIKATITHVDSTFLTLYENQTNTALDIDLDSGTVIANGGVMKFGFRIQVPSCLVKAAPIPDGGETGILKTDIDVTVKDDGTNAITRLYAYTAAAAYIA